jgi:hypothetical protein
MQPKVYYCAREILHRTLLWVRWILVAILNTYVETQFNIILLSMPGPSKCLIPLLAYFPYSEKI